MKKTEDKSVIYKSLWIMGTVMILAVLIIELVSIFLIQRDRRKTERLFSNTIESYGQFWEDKFASTSKALLLMSGTDSTPYYQQLCISKDPLTVETAKVQQQKIMIEMGERYGREMMLFVYVPERNIYFVSTEEGTTYAYQRAFKEKIISYIANQYQEPEKNWIFMEFDGHQYLARIYSAENGYIGAAFSLERIVSGFVGERKDLCVEVRDNETGEVKIHQGTRKSGISTTCVYPLKYTNAQIYVSMDEGMLDPGGTFGTLLLMGVMMLAIASILMAIGLQGKTVFAPLEQLRRAMEQYSTGDLDVRLPERENVSQIGQLYQTFNHMADQIQILRIDVYEKELERQRARSRFLQVQIQPHFYTNILNLIHGMAQIQDFEEIQKLCRVSAAYFRYLMGQKGTFVPLKEELRCLTSYIEIQHCRYKDMLEIQVNVEPEMEDEMILPLVIQTFVGNSVKHNIMLVPHLEIELTVKREGEHDLLILIEDNGLGFISKFLIKLIGMSQLKKKENISEYRM